MVMCCVAFVCVCVCAWWLSLSLSLWRGEPLESISLCACLLQRMEIDGRPADGGVLILRLLLRSTWQQAGSVAAVTVGVIIARCHSRNGAEGQAFAFTVPRHCHVLSRLMSVHVMRNQYYCSIFFLFSWIRNCGHKKGREWLSLSQCHIICEEKRCFSRFPLGIWVRQNDRLVSL